MEIELTKKFFAGLLHAEVRDLRWGLIAQTVNSEDQTEVVHPAVFVKGIEKFVFDIFAGEFVETKNYRVCKDAWIEEDFEDGYHSYIFRGIKVRTPCKVMDYMLYDIYGLRLVNSCLE